MANADRAPLLDAKLELGRRLTPEERSEIANLTVPVADVPAGPFDVVKLLDRHQAFASAVIEGVVVHSLQIGDHAGIQLLGPGDLLVRSNADQPAWVGEVTFRAPAPVRVAVLNNGFLRAISSAPHLAEGLYERLADQAQRLSGQLVICQLPRVDERVLAMLWLLAETWGHVTPGGVRLPLVLTHETLGGLIGARRPTVTLALRKLSENGSIVRQDSGWLLLELPPEPAGAPKVLAPELAGVSVSRWAREPEAATDPSVRYAGLRETVRQLREQHASDRQETRELLRRVRTARVRMLADRQRISGTVFTRRRPPST